MESPVKDAAEAEAWRAWRGGDERAFQVLYRLTLPRLSSYCRTLARDEDAAADLFQETWQKAFARAAGFRGDCAVSVWLLGIARNLWVSRGRRETVARKALLRQREGLREGEHLDPARGLAWRELLDALPRPQREAVEVYHMQQRSLRETAGILGVSHTEVLRRLKTAHDAIRQALDVPGKGLPASPLTGGTA